MTEFSSWREKVIRANDISPIVFGMTQDDVISLLGELDDVSFEIRNGKPVIFKYQDIEFNW